MKRVLAWVVSIVLLLSLCPMSAFAERECVDVYVNDTFVYDFQRGEDGTFDSFLCEIVTVFSDDSEEYESRTVYANAQTECGYGALICSDTQSQSPWQAGNTYPVTYGDNKSFNVEVRHSPIDWVEFDDCSLCLYDEESEKYMYQPNYTVYYKDGSSETTSYPMIYVEMPDGTDEPFALEFTDTQDSEPWQLGETYEVIGSALGVTDTFNVTVVSVASVTADDIEIIEGTGSWQDAWDEETEEYIENAWMYYDVEPKNVTVTLTDGTTVSGTIDEILEELGIWPSYDSDQSCENPWGLGEHTATIHAGNVSSTYTVTIVENPIQSIAVDTIEIIEGTGDWIDEMDEETGEYIENAWMCYDVEPEDITVTFKNGTSVTGSLYDIEETTGFSIGYRDNQSYKNPWGVGDHTATIYFGNVSAEYTVSIIESPIQSIAVDTIEIIEGAGEWVDELDEETGEYIENAWMEYDVEPGDITITLKDGTTVSGDRWDIEDQLGIWLTFESNQSYENPWELGEHTITIRAGKVSATYTVTIVENPIASITAKPIELFEGSGWMRSDEYWDENDNLIEVDWMEYDTEPRNGITVTFKDGTSVTGSRYDIEETTGFSIGYRDNQSYKNPWGVGDHTATIYFGNVSAEYTVSIIESPIESIKVEDVVLFEEIDSSYGEYYFSTKLSEVKLKDGTYLEIENNYYIIYDNHEYELSDNAWEMQMDEPWTVGNVYQVTATLLGIKTTFNVTIAENPIEKLEVISAPDKTDYLQGEYFNLKGATIRIKYNDGSYETVKINNDCTWFNDQSVVLQKFDRYSRISLTRAFQQVGAQSATVTLFEKSCEVPVTVKENLMESISIKENADKSVTITVNNSDNSSYDMKLLDMAYIWSGGDEGYDVLLFTDKGAFEACIDDSIQNKIAIGLYTENDTVIKSNSIALPEWFEVFKYAVDAQYYFEIDYQYNSQYNDNIPRLFNGVVTADNIDLIIELADAMESYEYDENIEWDENGNQIIDGDIIKDRVSKHFNIDNIDLTLSKRYDADTDTYYLFEVHAGGGNNYSTKQISYANGIWSLSFKIQHNNKENTVQIKMNEEFKITSFSVGETGYVHEHQYGKYVYNNDATTKKDGTKTRTCKICGDTQTVTAKGTKLPPQKTFTDVKKNAYYADAVAWAVATGVTNGTSETTFAPDMECTRAQIATFLWRAAGSPAVKKGTKNPFTDVKKNAYYYDAVLWAVGKGITTGTSKTTFSPNASCTRAQVATFLYRAEGSPSVKGTKNPFKDVGGKAYYYNAVLWAVKNGITTGTSKTTFGPDETCTRGQIATFLYRNYK